MDKLSKTGVSLKILQLGEKVLRQKARALSPGEIRSPYIAELIEMMRATMHDAPGVGLAAPQIGLSLQLAVIEDREAYLKDIPKHVLAERNRKPVPFQVIINPLLSPSHSRSATTEFFEGCLSMPGFTALVPRALSVKVQALNERAESVVIHAEGWHARILQHEIDHLQGVVYVDRMRSRSLMTLDNGAKYWKDKNPDQVRGELG